MLVGGGLEGPVVVVILGVATVAPALASLVQQQTMATKRRHFSGSVESILANCGLLSSDTPHRGLCYSYVYNGTVLVATAGDAQ